MDEGVFNVSFPFRLDSKTLLQRFNPSQGANGQWYHCSANLFSNYSPVNRENYISVAVKFLRCEKGDSTVQVIRKGQATSGSIIHNSDP